MKKKVLALVSGAVFLMFLPVMNAHSLENLVGSEQARALISGENTVLAQFNNLQPRLAPRHEAIAGLIESTLGELNPGIMVETLNLYTKPAGAGQNWSEDEAASLYNNLLALSSLAGIEYFSASRGTMRTFYETSTVIDGPTSKNPLPDPFHSFPPMSYSLYARQKDLTFGDNVYEYEFFNYPGAMIFVQQNITPLTYGIITAVGRNRLHSVVGIFDAGDYILVYAASMARAASLPGMRDRMRDSFSNRAEAVFKWFSARADRAYSLVN